MENFCLEAHFLLSAASRAIVWYGYSLPVLWVWMTKKGHGKLVVYPNPARGFINISLSDRNQSRTQVQLYDLNGRLVQEVSIVNASGKIHLINLPQGMYVVKAISEKQVFTGKVLVE